MPSWLEYLLSKGAPDPDGAMAQADVPSGDLLAHITGGLARKGADAVQSAVTAPRDAYRGDLQVFDPATGHVSDEAMRRANEMAGLAMTGSLPFSAPSGALRMFGGRNAATADHAALEQAQSLLGQGADRKAIWDQTGWFKGADDKWRFEIPDTNAKFATPTDTTAAMRGETLKFSDYLDHPELAKAYPRVPVTPAQHITMQGNGPLGDGVLGAFAGEKHGYLFNDAHVPSGYYADRLSPNEINRAFAQGRSTALHEGQHQIQDLEGFARGGAAENVGGMNAYRRLAGEVEARNVQARRDLTPEQRRAAPPWETQDVPDAQQIVRLGGSGPQMSMPVAKDDPLAALEAMLADIKPEAPPPGPRMLDPTAKSWDLYHGSEPGPDFARFDPTKSSNPAERGAVFFAPDAETAANYAGSPKAGAEAGSRVYRTTVDPGRTGVIDLAHLAETDPAFNARAREITAGHNPANAPLFDDYMAGFRSGRTQDQDIARQLAEMGYAPNPSDGTRISHGHGHIGAAIERAKAQGLDTAILRGLAEHGGDDQVIALTPNRVRSYYAPDQVLYSGGKSGAPVGAAVLSASGERAPIRAYHGSPHDFEGAIRPSERGALGPGVYFTPAEHVAQQYKGASGKVYEADIGGNIFDGLGTRDSSVNPYQVWRDQTKRLVDAAEPEMKDRIGEIAGKMQPSDGYPFMRRLASEYRDEGKAQDLLKRAGFDGISGHADGPEIAVFNPDIVKILRKYGLAGLAALGAGQGAVSNLGMGAPPQGMSN